ncbi:hypothetical protein FACS1894111_07820 [Clostridia bacterium]|nr:hypothetical protein FACS1894111_07820 [Clostridia bacterium]
MATEERSVNEKRRAKRFPLEISVAFEEMQAGDVTTVKFVEATVTDVSKSGMGFSCSKSLDLHSYYNANIKIWTGAEIKAVMEIIRAHQDEDGLYQYGGIFIGLGTADRWKLEIYQMFQESDEE